jgi:hypothetical protein
MASRIDLPMDIKWMKAALYHAQRLPTARLWRSRAGLRPTPASFTPCCSLTGRLGSFSAPGARFHPLLQRDAAVGVWEAAARSASRARPARGRRLLRYVGASVPGPELVRPGANDCMALAFPMLAAACVSRRLT